MLRLIAFALIPFALVAGNAVAAKGGPVAGGLGRLGRHSGRAQRPFATSPCLPRRRRPSPQFARATGACSATRRSAARSGFRSSRSTARPKGSPTTARRSCSPTSGRTRVETRFAVLSTATLRLKKAVTLPGLWAYDALSPNGRTLYATQYLGTGAERALQRPRGQPRHRASRSGARSSTGASRTSR